MDFIEKLRLEVSRLAGRTIHRRATGSAQAPNWHEFLLVESLIMVGGIPTALKNMNSSVGIIIPNNMEKYNMFQTTNQIVKSI